MLFSQNIGTLFTPVKNKITSSAYVETAAVHQLKLLLSVETETSH